MLVKVKGETNLIADQIIISPITIVFKFEIITKLKHARKITIICHTIILILVLDTNFCYFSKKSRRFSIHYFEGFLPFVIFLVYVQLKTALLL